MPYIGNNIRSADDYRLIDDISSGFNGSATTFALQVGGSSPVPFPKTPQQCLISVNGVIQEPDPTGNSGFTLTGTNIVFSSAPTNGHSFFGIIYATADYLNAGGTFPDGAVGNPSITFTNDDDTGLYKKGSGAIGFVSNGVEITSVDGDGFTIADSIIHAGDTDTKIRFGSANEFSVETAGVERFEITPNEVSFNDTGADVDFRIEGDSVANLFKIDASVDNIGIGMAAPKFSSGNGIELADNFFLGFGSGNGTRPDFQVGTTAGATLDIRCGTGADTVDLVVDTNGRIGIGTTSPSTLLHLNKTSGDCDLQVQATGTNTDARLNLYGHSGGVSQIRFGDQNDTNVGLLTYEHTNDSMQFRTADSERMRINSSGNVGINTSSPAAKLHVIGETRIDPASGESTLRFSVGGTEKGKIAVDSSSNLLLETANSERLRVDSSGRLLIGISSSQSTRTGTSSFSAKLQISSDSEAAAAITRYSNGVDSGRLSIQKGRGTNASKAVVQQNDNLGQILFSGWDGDTFTNGAKIECEVDGTPGDDDMPGRLVFFTTADGAASSTERMRIDSSGQLLVGTTSQTTSTGVITGIRAATESRIVVGNSNTSASGVCGYDMLPSNTVTGARIECRATEDFSTVANRTADLGFFTRKDGTLAEKLTILSSGNVGIGTTSPSNAVVINTPGSAANCKLEISQSDGGGGTSEILFSDSVSGRGRIFFDHGSSPEGLKFEAAGTQTLIITTGGRVGIGTTDPNAQRFSGSPAGNLHLRGTKPVIYVSESDSQDGNGVDRAMYMGMQNGNTFIGSTSAAGMIFQCGDGTASEKMRISSSGRVGINESNPSEMLHIKDDGNSDIFGGLIIKSNNNTVHTKYGWRGVDGSDSLRFGTGDTERMRIDSSGHFFFSTTSQGVAGGHFNIDGSGSGRNAFSVKGTTGNYVMVSDAGGSTGDHINFRNYTGGDNETGRIKDDGSNVTYHTTSDYRLKENVVAISDGISRVKQLNPIRHTWINNPTPGTIDGWLAHELDEVCPYAVDGEKDATNPDGSINPQGVDYGRITPLLTAALKEAIAKIETLETEVAALKAA